MIKTGILQVGILLGIIEKNNKNRRMTMEHTDHISQDEGLHWEMRK